jgi:hypothetical protein
VPWIPQFLAAENENARSVKWNRAQAEKEHIFGDALLSNQAA